jgi:hypothetical protein
MNKGEMPVAIIKNYARGKVGIGTIDTIHCGSE